MWTRENKGTEFVHIKKRTKDVVFVVVVVIFHDHKHSKLHSSSGVVRSSNHWTVLERQGERGGLF